MEVVFDIMPCAMEIIKILEKHNVSIERMDRVLDAVKKEVYTKTPVHTVDLEFSQDSQ